MTTEQTPDPVPQEPREPAAPPPAPPPEQPRTFEQRMDDFGRRAGEAGEKLGREAEAAAERWTKDPVVSGYADTATRVWGLIVLAVGLYFFADFTLGLPMPDVAWRDIWPLALILLGLAVLLRGMATRRA
jgi:cell wall-active antibiotic response 4TMS protein YvqF